MQYYIMYRIIIAKIFKCISSFYKGNINPLVEDWWTEVCFIYVCSSFFQCNALLLKLETKHFFFLSLQRDFAPHHH